MCSAVSGLTGDVPSCAFVFVFAPDLLQQLMFQLMLAIHPQTLILERNANFAMGPKAIPL